jgi:putative colanic acid biosysnthesis UDP-glucose lipid carrier transferase
VPKREFFLLTKRAVDLIFSIVVIVGVLWWLTPILGILILIDSKGPIFFVQSRDRRNRKPFPCLKFRTMWPNPEADTLQTQPNDSRITRLGIYLRKSHLDELPQFVNIFLGQMSLIGPRPHMHSDTHTYAPQIENYLTRLDVKPGFTGLAQVNDLCGNTSNLHDMKARVRMDVFYVTHAGPSLDSVILWRSLQVMIRKFLGFLGVSRKPDPVVDLVPANSRSQSNKAV